MTQTSHPPIGFLRAVWALSKPYFAQSEQRRSAWLLLFVIVVLNLGSVGLSVWFNQWYNDFYNSLQEKDFAAFQTLLLHFAGVAAAFIVVAVYRQYLQSLLQLRWRRWMTEHWVSDWLDRKHYYHMQMFSLGTDNPDQRLSEDLRLFPTYTLTLLLGLMNSIVTLASFLGILWTLSGEFSFALGGTDYSIPGYMVWVAIVYAAGGTWLTHRIGRPLIRLHFDKQRVEADFRFHLVRVREHAEGIAFQHGETVERTGLIGRFAHVFATYFDIMLKNKQLTWFTAGYTQLAVIFPFVVAAPRYFSGAIQLGGLMQTVSAFGQVQEALSYIINSYTDIAEWRAVINRLTGFRLGLEDARRLAAQQQIAVETAADGLHIDGLDLALPDGLPLMHVDGLSLTPADSLLVKGRSGKGKTTLLRAIAGLWPFGRGTVRRPDDRDSLFLPQRPYLPHGSLRAALAYPHDPVQFSDADFRAALQQLDLAKLADRLDEEAVWDQQLSGGEQQRVQLARALLMKPHWLYLDEATSALDDVTEQKTLAALKAALPHTAILSIGHKPALEAFHRQHLLLDGGEGRPSRLVAAT